MREYKSLTEMVRGERKWAVGQAKALVLALMEEQADVYEQQGKGGQIAETIQGLIDDDVWSEVAAVARASGLREMMKLIKGSV